MEQMFDFTGYYDNTACISSTGRSVTYGELEGLAKRISSHVESKRLVFSLCRTSIGSIAGYIAFMNNGDPSLLLDADIDKQAFYNLVKTYHPEYLWVPADSELTPDTEMVYETEGYVLYRIQNDKPTPVADDLALLLATSGSLGSPKLVRLTRKNLRSNALSIIEYLGITNKERPILGLPMHYAFGLSVINTHLMTGATLLLSKRSFVEREFWQFAIENCFTSYSGVPYAFEVIKRMKIWEREMPSLRTLTQAGGMLNRETVRFFSETFAPRGAKLYIMYGQAEATARISYLPPEQLKERPGSIGKAIPGGLLSLTDENGREITTPGTVGEMVYRGVNVSLGYAECAADLMKGDENGGVVHTGDLAYRDSDGYYYITGRKGRFVKLFGHRIGLDYAEELLEPLLGECYCCGDDSHLTIYTTNSEVEVTIRAIDLLSSRTRIPRKAFSAHRIEVIPRNEAGKVLYEKLK